VTPTADDYSHRLGGGPIFGGILIGAVPLVSMLGILLTNLCFKKNLLSYKAVLVLLSVGSILGNVLYAVAGLTHAKWTLLVSRVIIGACNGFNLPTLYISITVGLQRRSEITFYWSALITIAYALGPALAAVFEVFLKAIRIDNLILDADTAPGWFMAIVWLLFIAKAVVLFQELPLSKTAPRPPPEASEHDRDRLPIIGSCALFSYLCAGQFVLTAAEVYAVNVGTNYWGWRIMDSALFLAAIMLVSGITNMIAARITRCSIQSDVTGILGGSLLSCIACIPLFNFDLHAVYSQALLLSVALVLVLTFIGIVRSYGLAASSKLVPAHLKPTMNNFQVMGMLLGRGVGAIVGSIVNPDSFAPIVLGTLGFAGLVGLSAKGFMAPCGRAN